MGHSDYSCLCSSHAMVHECISQLCDGIAFFSARDHYKGTCMELNYDFDAKVEEFSSSETFAQFLAEQESVLDSDEDEDDPKVDVDAQALEQARAPMAPDPKPAAKVPKLPVAEILEVHVAEPLMQLSNECKDPNISQSKLRECMSFVFQGSGPLHNAPRPKAAPTPGNQKAKTMPQKPIPKDPVKAPVQRVATSHAVSRAKKPHKVAETQIKRPKGRQDKLWKRQEPLDSQGWAPYANQKPWLAPEAQDRIVRKRLP